MPTHAASGHLGSMGLKGLWATLGNLTAVGLVCLMFYQAQSDFRTQAREDRTMFREELKALHARADVNAELIRSSQSAIAQMAVAVRELADEVKRFKGRE